MLSLQYVCAFHETMTTFGDISDKVIVAKVIMFGNLKIICSPPQLYSSLWYTVLHLSSQLLPFRERLALRNHRIMPICRRHADIFHKFNSQFLFAVLFVLVFSSQLKLVSFALSFMHKIEFEVIRGKL